MPATRYIFADLDTLNQDVCTYMRAHSKEFSEAELAKHSPISAQKLTELLSRSDGATKYFHGSYYYLKLKDVEAFRAAGWDMRPKSESKYRTLGHLPKPKHTPEGENSKDTLKTLVLVAGKLAASVLHRVKTYFDAGWCVHCYCFKDRDDKVYERLASENPSRFQCIYLDDSVRKLLKEMAADKDTLLTTRDLPRTDYRRHPALGDMVKVPGSSTSNHKLAMLYQHIHALQSKVLEMETESAANQSRQHKDLLIQLQLQKIAFEHQLAKQDEEFQKRLREHRKAVAFMRKRHEQYVEERVEVYSNDVASALTNLGELSERVKRDVCEYQRARLDEELKRWRHETTGYYVYKPNTNNQEEPVNSTLLDAVDTVLRQNGVPTGIKNWRVALMVLVIHKVTAWLSSASFGMALMGVVATAVAIMIIALCFADAGE
ncbi:unnamed protein product [Phytophthora lilii]|uniref:Unnamed protein product n=1 Tax=Phytophthora lilii TaxID=2077276 RepID=A0A9W6WWR2_9STRA|nr:unnamed protein product [Phytophthora lilii]